MQTNEKYKFLSRICVVVIAICLSSIFINSFLKITTSYNENHYYVITPFNKEVQYEKTSLYQEILTENIEYITRFAVIANQLETNGSYDHDKQINIVEYANRTNVSSTKEEYEVTFYLDDLIKWGNYGFDFETVTGTYEEISNLFKNTADEMIKEESIHYSIDLLIQRYKTTDGKELIEIANNIEEYEVLKKYLMETAESLFHNYSEYVELSTKYLADNSNINYFIQIEENGEIKNYTNVVFEQNLMSSEERLNYMQKMGAQFLFFNPDKVAISTNTGISAQTMRSIIRKYEYVLKDNTRVYYSVDLSYQAIDDLQKGQQLYSRFMPFYWQTLIGALIAFIVYILCIWRTLVLEVKRSQIKEKGIDKIPLEMLVLLFFLIEWIIFYVTFYLLNAYKTGGISFSWLPAIFAILAFMANEFILLLVISIVQRKNSNTIWKHTIAVQASKKIKSIFLDAYENGTTAAKTWILYTTFLLINLILVLLGLGGVIGAFIIDMTIGVLIYRDNKARSDIVKGIERIRNGDTQYKINTRYLYGENLVLAKSVNTIGDGIRVAVENSMKDEKLKTDLITNVSHDIKTPLTSIISYVDLLKRENIESEIVKQYIHVLDVKSQRLKQLTDDLVEASKISSGNITIELIEVNFGEFIQQIIGEFADKLEEKNLVLIKRMDVENVSVSADAHHMFRVMENLFSNICKYALEGTRVYIVLEKVIEESEKVVFSIKNISANPLQENSSILMERFIRGDESRNTEGSGLGLSIARNLVELQGGEFFVESDADLFKITIKFRIV
ncbi:MAG: histidine kinase dimerization/phospho-acceptor domain-containing protein [Lachnospiraceae bacterium]